MKNSLKKINLEVRRYAARVIYSTDERVIKQILSKRKGNITKKKPGKEKTLSKQISHKTFMF